MKTKLLALLLVAGGALFAESHFSIGIGVGSFAPAYGYYAPPLPPAAPGAVYAPAPGPGYTWVNGYWYPAGPRYAWHAGYWARPPYGRSYWVAPRYTGHRYYGGYWRR
jgi:hypothetical protein